MKETLLHFQAVILSLFFSVCFGIETYGAEIEHSQSVYVFGGRYTENNTGRSALPFTADYENNYLLAVAYSRDLRNLDWKIVTGLETGFACRLGHRFTGELWGGIFFRHHGINIADMMMIKPSITAGISIVNNSIGTERVRERTHNGNANVLFYLGPEIAFSLPSHPQWEMVYRLHHRSGADKLLGDMMEGHNASTIGLRHRF